MLDDALIARTQAPLNAETPLEALCRSHVTPTELFYVRNHDAIPDVDPDAYRLKIGGEVREPLVLSLRDLRDRFPRADVTATIACAGNRRSELSRLAPIPEAVQWGPGAIGNAVWAGARLADVLATAGVRAEARHVDFTGLDLPTVEGRAQAFDGSIPIDKALAPEVLLAYEMNGEPLSAEHGFPLRTVVPGYIGARSVKWLAEISVEREPSAGYFQSRDYALQGRPLDELALNSAFCRPVEGAPAEGTSIDIAGWAIGRGGRLLERVEVSADGGRSWVAAVLEEHDGEPWSWRLWHATIDADSDSPELVVRAWDGSGQPESLAAVWNERGYMNNAWHRVALTSTP
jgi:sulfite oxidase